MQSPVMEPRMPLMTVSSLTATSTACSLDPWGSLRLPPMEQRRLLRDRWTKDSLPVSKIPLLPRMRPPGSGKTKFILEELCFDRVLIQAKEGLPLPCAHLAGGGGFANCREGGRGEGHRRGDGQGGGDEKSNGEVEEDECGREGSVEGEGQGGGRQHQTGVKTEPGALSALDISIYVLLVITIF